MQKKRLSLAKKYNRCSAEGLKKVPSFDESLFTI